jgi:hypothetical protein
MHAGSFWESQNDRTNSKKEKKNRSWDNNIIVPFRQI